MEMIAKPTSQRVDRLGTRTASARIESSRPSIADGRAMLSAVAGVHIDTGLRARSSSSVA